MFGQGIDPTYAKDLLNRVGLSHRLDYRPSQLSVGQQQRVAMARALANHPALVLADEPTGNLDPHHAGEALGLICEICHELGAALLLVSHDRKVLEQFGEVQRLVEINRAMGNQIGSSPVGEKVSLP
jgi:ABC-type lipoprotein export system ATPase subunit